MVNLQLQIERLESRWLFSIAPADSRAVALPTPLASVAPAGSLIYDQSTTGLISTGGDTESFTLPLSAGQTLSAAVTPSAGLQAGLILSDPSGVVAFGAGALVGDPALLQTAPIAVTGTYTLTVSGLNGTSGGFTVLAYLNSALQADLYGGPTENTQATAQDLTGSFISLGSGASRGAVVGSLSNAAPNTDAWYSFPLSAGDTVTLAGNVVSGSAMNLELRNSAGAVVAGTSAAGTSQLIPDFTAPAAGVYYAHLFGATSTTSYDLVVTRNAEFANASENSLANDQPLASSTENGTLLAVGSVTGAAPTTYSLPLGAGGLLQASTSTPGSGSSLPNNPLVPELLLYNASGTLVESADSFGTGSGDAQLSYLVPAGGSGTYYLQVVASTQTAQPTTGDYILTVVPPSQSPSGNHAPLLSGTGAPTLSAIHENTTVNAGTPVSALVAAAGITDVDPGAIPGIAVDGVDNSNGTWQFSTNQGAIWTNFGAPSDSAARLLAVNDATLVRFVPNANFSGVVAGLTFRAWDQTSGSNGGVANAVTNGGSTAFSTATETASIAVNFINQPPTLAAISSEMILENAGPQTVNLTGISPGLGDPSTETVQITATSSNPALVPTPTINYSNPNTSGTLSFTPVASAAGTATITLTVTNNGGTANGGASTLTESFTVTVLPVNQPPTINPIANPPPTLENAGVQTAVLSGISAGPANQSSESLSVTATSSNPALIPNPTVTYTSPGSTGSLSYTPLPDACGTGVITVTVTSSGSTANGGVDTATQSFTVTVTGINQPPTLTPIANPQTMLVNAGTQTVQLTGISSGPPGNLGQSLTITATSSNPALIPNPTVNYTNGNSTGTLSYAPAAGASGMALITVTLQNNGGTANGGSNTLVDTFLVWVASGSGLTATHTVVSVPSGTAAYGQSVTISADSSATAGTISFFASGTTLLGSAPVAANGVASLTLSNLPVGQIPITAVYTDQGGNYAESVGSTVLNSSSLIESTAAITQPGGIAVDSAGDVFVADPSGNRVLEINYSTGAVTTVAGTGTAGFSGDGGPATAAELDAPADVLVDSAGDLFIADSENNRIREVNHLTGILTTIVGNGGFGYNGDHLPATVALLWVPSGLAMDSAGDLFISDSGNNRVREVNATTDMIITVAGGGTGYTGSNIQATAAELSDVEGIALDSAGDLFIANEPASVINEVNHATGVISNFAGMTGPGFNGDGGPASAATLDDPYGVAVDSAGDVYIVDTGNNRIREVNAATKIINTVVGLPFPENIGNGGPASAAGLSGPKGVAFDSGGDLFISDTGDSVVREVVASVFVVPDKTTLTVAAPATSTLGQSVTLTATVNGTMQPNEGLVTFSSGGVPLGTVAVSGGQASLTISSLPAGNDGIVAEYSDPNHAFLPSGAGTISTITPASTSFPYATTTDSAGDLFIAGAGYIYEINAATGATTTIAGNGGTGYGGDGGPATAAVVFDPAGITVDSVGDVIIADQVNNRIREINHATGMITTIVGTGLAGYNGDNRAATTADLDYPTGVALDSAGDLFIADQLNNRIREVNLATGMITTIAGTGVKGFSGNFGPATAAEFSEPWDIVLDSAGDLFISDRLNNQVREINQATSLVTPVAGNGTAGYAGDLGPAVNAEMDYPSGLALDSAGDLFIADELDNRVREINAVTGTISTVSGNGTSGLSGDGGPGMGAELDDPLGVYVDSAGDIYIADSYNDRVQEISAAPVVVVKPGSMAATSIGLAAPATAGYGQAVTLTAAVGSTTTPNEGNVTFSAGGLPLGTAAVNAGVASLTTSALSAGIDAITASYSDPAANFAGSSASANVTVSQATPGISIGAPAGNYDNGPISAFASVGGSSALEGVAPTITYYSGTAATGAPLSSAPSLVGTYTAIASFAGSADYAAVQSNPATFFVSPANLVVTVNNLAKTYGAALPTLTGTVTGVKAGDNITASYSTSATAASPVQAGGYPITATLNDPNGKLGNYTVTVVNGTLTVNRASLTITANNQTMAYGGTVPALTASYAGFVNGDTSASLTTPPTLSTTATPTSPVSGNPYRISVNGAVTANYTITYVAGQLTITGIPTTTAVSASSSSINYGQPDLLSATVSAGSTPNEGTVTFKVGGTTLGSAPVSGGAASLSVTSLPAGSDLITATYSDSGGNYATSSGTAAQSVTVSGLATSTSLIPSLNNTVYGQADLLTATVTSSLTVNQGTVEFLNGATVLGTAAVGSAGQATLSVSSLPTGPDSLTAIYSDSPADFTSSTSSAAPVTVGNAPLVTASDPGGVYKGAGYPATALVAGAGALEGVTPALTYYTGTAATGTGSSAAPSHAGTYTVVASFAGSTDYAAATSSATTFTIAPAPLTITANNQSKVYDAALPTLTTSYSGFVGSDSVSSLTMTPTLSTTASVASPVSGSPYAITASGAADPDYTISYVAGSLTVTATPSAISITASPTTVAYDQTVVLTAAVTGTPPPNEGTVTFLLGATVLGTAPVSGGAARLSLASIPGGLAVISAGYSDAGGNYQASSTVLNSASTIGTIAGNGGPTTVTSLSDPNGVAVDSAGDIFIADNSNQVIREINHATGVITVVAGSGITGFAGDGGPATAAKFNLGSGQIAVDSAGDIFIADSNNYRVREFVAATGVIKTVAGDGQITFNGNGIAATLASLQDPTGLALDSAGDLLIADYGHNQIREVNHVTGLISTIAGTTGGGFSGDNGPATMATLYQPESIALDSAGNLFIADTFNNRIREVNHVTGIITTVAGNGTSGTSGNNGPATSAELLLPQGVTVDSAGDVYFSDYENGVREVTAATGLISLVVGGYPEFSGDGGPATAAAVSSPEQLALDSAGDLLIADSGNNRIREVNTSGIINTIAGAGISYGGDGGPASAAELSDPAEVAADSAGDIFFVDTANNRIREINRATSIITTIAGNGVDGVTLNEPSGVAVDSAGDVFIADGLYAEVLEINHATQKVTRVAGTGSQGYSGDGGPATAAELFNPLGIAVDSSGDIFIVDSQNIRIREVNHATGIITTLIANVSANDVAVDANGDVFVSGIGGKEVEELKNGVLSAFAGNAGNFGYSGDGGPATAAEFGTTDGLAVDSAGDVFITDTYFGVVREVHTNGTITTVAGTGLGGFAGDGGAATASQLKSPEGVAIDAAGDLIISDTGNGRIRVVAAGTNVNVRQVAPSLTVSDAGGTYDNAAFAATDTVAGVVAGVDNTPGPSLEGVSPTPVYYAGTAVSGTPLGSAPSAAGTYTVVASFSGSRDYLSATSSPQTFVISPAPLTLAANSVSMTYGGPLPGFYGTLTGTAPGDTFDATFSSNAVGAGEHVVAGGYTIVPQPVDSGDKLGNYSLTIQAGTLTVTPATLAVTDAGGQYTGATFPASVTVAGVVSGLDSNPAASLEGTTPTLSYYSGTAVTGTALSGAPSTAGTYSVLASFAGSADYVSSAANTTFIIGQAKPALNVSDNSGTFTDIAFTASESVIGVGSQSNSAASLESITPSLTYYSGTTATGTALPAAPSSAGTYAVLASFAGSTDYGSTLASAIFTISQAAPTVSVSDNSGIFTGAAYTAATSSIEGITPALLYYSGTAANGSALSGAPSNAGTYTVLASFAGSADYTSGTASKTFTVARAVPTVTVLAAGGTYNDSVFSATAEVNGSASLEGMTPTLTYYSGSAATGAALGNAPSNAGTYSVIGSFAGSTDYATRQSLPATFVIGMAPTTIALATSAQTINDGQSVTLTATVSGSPTPDEGSVTISSGEALLGTVPVNNGVATLVVPDLPFGSDVMTATYGDANGNYAPAAMGLGPNSTILDVAGRGNYWGDGGPATAATLNHPEGLAVDTAGDIFIADSQNNVIRELNHATGIITTIAGTGSAGYNGDNITATAAELSAPNGLVLSSAGDLFIADTGNHRVRELNLATGVLTTVAGTGVQGSSGDNGPATLAELDAPVAIAIDSAGDLFIADNLGNRVREVSHTSGVITTIAGAGTAGFTGDGGAATAAELNNPSGIAVDLAGDVYVADTGNEIVREVVTGSDTILLIAGVANSSGFGGDGGPATLARLNTPVGVAVDTAGDILILDQYNDRVREVNATTGIISTLAGDGKGGFSGNDVPATAADMTLPGFVTVDAAGNLFISATQNSLVLEVNRATDLVSAVAGSNYQITPGDGGLATAATLNVPQAVAIDSVGDIFIADGLDNVIREINHLTGLITTVVGNGIAGESPDGTPATAAELDFPAGIALDSAGDLFISDSRNNLVREVNHATGTLTTIAGIGFSGYNGDDRPGTTADLTMPEGLALDSKGDLFIADQGNELIRELNLATGIITTVAGAPFGSGYNGDGVPATATTLFVPTSVTLDSAGDLFIADEWNHRIREVSHTTGIISTVAGNGTFGNAGDGGQATAAELSYPGGIAVDSSGDLFIADYWTGRVSEVNHATGDITTIAGGNPGVGGNDGPGSAAVLSDPLGLCLDSSGNLFIVDGSANVVRELANGPVISVISPAILAPNVTGTTVVQNSQSTAGLIITPNSQDIGTVTYFQVSNVVNGTLYLNDGRTPVIDGEFITLAQGAAGLKFTPTANSTAVGSFAVQASTSPAIAGLGGPVVAATITISVVPPTSSVSALGYRTSNTSIPVSWSGTPGSGGPITSYNILVSTDGGAFTPWLTATTETSATFPAQTGHTYSFTSQATDTAGNTEPAHTTADTTVTVMALPWQNPGNPLNVLGLSPATIVPADALAVINYLNLHPGDSVLVQRELECSWLGVSG